MTVSPCHNSICVNISGWNQRQIPNDNFANDSKNRKHWEFLARGLCSLSVHNLGINPWYLQIVSFSVQGKYSGQQGLLGPTSLQLIHSPPAQWSDLHRVILTHWSLHFLSRKAELTTAPFTSWELLQHHRNLGPRGKVHCYCIIITTLVITIEDRLLARASHSVFVLGVLVCVCPVTKTTYWGLKQQRLASQDSNQGVGRASSGSGEWTPCLSPVWPHQQLWVSLGWGSTDLCLYYSVPCVYLGLFSSSQKGTSCIGL